MPVWQLCAQRGSGESQGEEGGEIKGREESRRWGRGEGGGKGTIFESQSKTLQPKLLIRKITHL